MNELQGLFIAIGSLIGAIVGAYTAFHKSKQERHKSTVDELQDELKEKKEDAELYRQRWLKAEQANDLLRKELDDAKRKNC